MRYKFQHGERVYEVEIERRGEGYRAVIDGQAVEFALLDQQSGQVSLQIGGRPATIYFAADGGRKWFSLEGCTYLLEPPAGRARAAAGEQAVGEAVRAPMPARVRSVEVSEGEAVEKGQTLLLLEAMKMEIRVRAPAGGRVTRLLVKAEQSVEKDQLLAEIGE